MILTHLNLIWRDEGISLSGFGPNAVTYFKQFDAFFHNKLSGVFCGAS